MKITDVKLKKMIRESITDQIKSLFTGEGEVADSSMLDYPYGEDDLFGEYFIHPDTGKRTRYSNPHYAHVLLLKSLKSFPKIIDISIKKNKEHEDDLSAKLHNKLSRLDQTVPGNTRDRNGITPRQAFILFVTYDSLLEFNRSSQPDKQKLISDIERFEAQYTQ